MSDVLHLPIFFTWGNGKRAIIACESTVFLSTLESIMAEKPEEIKEGKTKRQNRIRLSAKDALKRMQAFDKRRKKFIAAIREGKD